MVSNLPTCELKCQDVLLFFLYFLTHYFSVDFWCITQQVFVAEEWVHDTYKEADGADLARTDVEKSLGALR